MKRFSHLIGTLLMVLALVVSLIGCVSTVNNEISSTKSGVEVKENTESIDYKDKQGFEEIKYPYGIKPIIKNTRGDKEFDLFVIHTNDVHGRIEPSHGSTIGYARLATMVKEAKRITDNILVVDAGDTLHGTTIANIFEGEVPMKLMEMVGYDVFVPGNHDYNFGSKRLEKLVYESKNSNVKTLSANALTDNDLLLFQPYQIYDYNGFKIAVIGLTTPDVKIKSHPKNTEGISFMSDLVVKNAQYLVDQLRELVDYIMVVGHIGLDDGDSLLTSDFIAKNVKGIDLFVDGHSNTELPEGLVVNDTLIVQAGEYMKNLGVVQLHVKDGKVQWNFPLLISDKDVLEPENSELAKDYGISTVPADPMVQKYIDSKKERLSSIDSAVVADLPFTLQGEREYVRIRSTNLGRMLSKAMTEASGADFTLTNGGGIRASIPNGPVTLGEINTVLPFNNMVVVVELTGEEVYEVMEKGFSKYPKQNGGFIQTDLIVKYSRRSKVGNRIKSLKLHGKMIDKNAKYLVATNDFLASGGDGYTMLDKPRVKEIESLEEVFSRYLKENYPVK